MSKNGKAKRFLDAIGGRKFIGLILAIITTMIMGKLDTNLMYVFIAYMASNALKDNFKVNLGNGKT